MKIIDCHTHFPGSLLGDKPRPIAPIREEFTKAGLSGAWLFTTDGLFRDCAKHNDILAQTVREHRDFFVPFGTVNPHDGAEAAIAELERCKNQLHMAGVKFHPWLQAFSQTHPALLPILQRAGELGMPVIYHDGTPPYSTPLQIAAAAEQASNTQIILGHAGLDDLYEDAILACRRHPNIYLCCCANSCGPLQEIVKRCPGDRLLFGSDGGFCPNLVHGAIAKLRTLDWPPDRLNSIFYENAMRLIPWNYDH